MAYITQAQKKELAPGIKKVLKKYGIKGTISISNNIKLNVNLHEGRLDLIGEENNARRIWAERNRVEFRAVGCFQIIPSAAETREGLSSEVTAFYNELSAAMRGELWYDNSDPMTGYFDTAYYLQINVGKFDKTYRFDDKPYRFSGIEYKLAKKFGFNSDDTFFTRVAPMAANIHTNDTVIGSLKIRYRHASRLHKGDKREVLYYVLDGQ